MFGVEKGVRIKTICLVAIVVIFMSAHSRFLDVMLNRYNVLPKDAVDADYILVSNLDAMYEVYDSIVGNIVVTGNGLYYSSSPLVVPSDEYWDVIAYYVLRSGGNC